MRSAYVLTVVVGLSILPVLSARDRSVRAAPASHVSLFTKADSSIVAEAQADGLKEVVLVVASQPNRNAEVVERLGKIGARVLSRHDGVDYVATVVPIERADEVAGWPAIEAVNADATIFRIFGDSNRSGMPDEQAASPVIQDGESKAQPSPGPETPRENAFLPTRDIGAPQFVTRHPTFDGRGVTIAIVDDGADISSPELQTATTLEGKPTRKIIDWRLATDPPHYALPLTAPIGGLPDCRWVDMRARATTASGELTFLGETYRAPRDGEYRVGLFDERRPGCYYVEHWLRGDVNRDGNPPGSSGLFAVLWNERTGEVWVDTNQDHDLRDERAMRDYPVRFDIGVFRHAHQATPSRDAVPFVVQTDITKEVVAIGFTNGRHGTMVASTAAGKGFFGGAFDGVAPGAQLVVIGYINYYAHTIIEALITAATHPRVDIVQVAIGATSELSDGRRVIDVIVDRLTERYRKPFFISAGNGGPAVDTSESPSQARSAFSVGAYISRSTWLANYAVHAPRDEYLHVYSARGPSEDGRVRPDFVAPAGAVASQPAVLSPGARGAARLPAGYYVGGGTSQSSPFAAGAAALLISAARQSGVPCDPARLRIAMTTGARFVPGYGAHEQGSGLLDVPAAWEALRRLRDAPLATIVSRGPVKTVLSHMLATPNQGAGLYEREGWRAGQRESRTVTLTRTTGPRGPVTYDLAWLGNDGTFSAMSAIALPLNEPVGVEIGIAPAQPGIHSAILNVVDRSTRVILHRVLTTIIAAEPLDAHNHFQLTEQGEFARPGHVSHFLMVPPGVPVLDLALQAENGAAKVLIHEPTGQSVDASPFYQAEPYQQGGWRRAIERPMPGVWEVVIKNDQALTSPEPPDASPLPSVHYTMTARLLGAHLDSAGPTTSTASNTLAPFEGRIEGAGLGTAFNDRPILTASAPRRLYDIAVPPGTTLLSVDLEKPSDVSADVDLYLFDCTGKECTIKARSSRAGSIETISVRAPATGVWKAAVVADSLPSGEVQVGYRDLVVHPLFGRIDVADMSNAHATGASWQATSAVHVEAVPFANRRTLVGLVQVVADGVESSKHQQIVEADDRLATWREVGRWSIPLAIMPAVIPANAARATQ